MSASRSAAQAPVAETVILDSGGVTALTGNSLRARAWMAVLDDYAGEVVIPSVILAEVTTGDPGRDAGVDRVLKRLLPGRRPAPIDDQRARSAGALRFRSGVLDVVDALVVAEARRQPGTVLVLTSDPADITALVDGAPGVHVRSV